MKTTTVLTALAATASASHIVNRTFENYLERQYNVSLTGALLNIGGLDSPLVVGASPGVVVASPSRDNPNYFYTWTRDAALVELMLADEIYFGTDHVGNISLQKVLEDYTTAQARLQTVTNPSGALWPAGLGLAEPKFFTNLTRFNSPWGRPQNDGPALRASTFMEIAELIFLRNPNASQIVSQLYWPLILNDLRHVGQYWNTTSYDLWEEVNGNSFFTTTAQHRALVQGSLLAARLNQTCAPCSVAPQIACFLSSYFWNSTGNYMLANINTNQVTRSQINADPILASMHAFDINATCHAASLQPCNSKTLATHKVWVDSFRNLYPINKNASKGAVACGRYPEDTYYDGNPWYITTLAAAEVLYDAAAQYTVSNEVVIDDISLPFFRDLFPNITTGTYNSYSSVKQIVNGMRSYADGFMKVVQQYTPANGTLDEQINKTSGEPTSAIALTWSYAAFITAAERRQGYYPPSWGAGSELANNVSSVCGGSYISTNQYAPAIAAGAPNISTPCSTEVLFQLNYVPGNGQGAYLVGNTSLLGGASADNLNVNGAVIQAMIPTNYTNKEPKFIVQGYVPAGVPIAYKYVLLNTTDYTFLYENITRYVTPPACGNMTAEITYSYGSFPPM